MAGGEPLPLSEKYITALKLGTDPQSSGYWGTPALRSASGRDGGLGTGAALLQDTCLAASLRERDNLHRWLNQISDAQMPDSNWNYFAIMVQLGFKRAGLPWDRAPSTALNLMEAYYLGDGWYSDGPGAQRLLHLDGVSFLRADLRHAQWRR
jgi:hypothetical protein